MIHAPARHALHARRSLFDVYVEFADQASEEDVKLLMGALRGLAVAHGGYRSSSVTDAQALRSRAGILAFKHGEDATVARERSDAFLAAWLRFSSDHARSLVKVSR